MDIIKEIFDNFIYDSKKLLDFGFQKQKNTYTYNQLLSNKQFELKVIISDKNIKADVWDKDTNDIYTLVKVESAKGTFISKIKNEFETILYDIRNNCFTPDVFKTTTAKQLIKYIKDKYNNDLEYLWQKFPNNAIARRTDNKKWYIAFLTIKADKIGLKGNKEIEIIDIRMKPEDIDKLVDNKVYFTGYHMNKKHWITIPLNTNIDITKIKKLIDESFILAKEN